MESNAAVVQAEEAVDASVAAFMAALAGGSPAASGSAAASGGSRQGGRGAGGAPVAEALADGSIPLGAGAGVLGDDPLQRVVDAALDVLGGVVRSEAKLAAAKALAAAVLAGATRAMNPPPGSPYEATAQDRSLVAEVGCALAIGDRAAGALLAEAHALTTSLPRTLAALQAGTISWAHARTMVDQAVRLDPSAAAALEAHFLDPEAPDAEAPGAVRGCPMGEMPAYRFKAKARTWRERHHPESLEKRHAKSAADRRVEYWPDNDGMAWIAAYLPADQASAVWNRLTALSRGLQGPAEARTLTQLRADSFAAGLLNAGLLNAGSSTGTHGAGSAGEGGNGVGDEPRAGKEAGPSLPIRAEVLVSVPVFSLMGLTGEPAMLDGYGPIPASMARDLVAGGANSFYRVLVDPRDGAPLEIGRTSYRVSKAMRNWLRLRDGKCPFPGCSNHSLDNEADHLLAWHKGGTTGVSNLGQPCPKHHRLRHTSGWKPTPATKTEPPGWTSPTGRTYKSEHQDWEPPRWPEGAVPAELRALDDLVEMWPPPNDLSGVSLPNDLSGVSPPDGLPDAWPPAAGQSLQDLSLQDLYPKEEFPEDTFADWFLPGYQLPKDPLPEDVWWGMACQASAGVP